MPVQTPNPLGRATQGHPVQGRLVGVHSAFAMLEKVDDECKELTNGTVAAVLNAGDSVAAENGILELLRGAGAFLGTKF